MIQEKLARVISFILHPVVFAIAVPFLVTFKESGSIFDSLRLTLFSSLFLCMAAGAFFVLTPKDPSESMEKHIDITNKNNRYVFYTLCTFFSLLYFIASVIFAGISFPLSIIALGITLGIVSFSLVNFYMKISIHTAIVAAFVVTYGVLYGFFPLLGIIWILPLIIWSRLTLHKHTNKEILAGIIVGTVVALGTVLIYRQISL